VEEEENGTRFGLRFGSMNSARHIQMDFDFSHHHRAAGLVADRRRLSLQSTIYAMFISYLIERKIYDATGSGRTVCFPREQFHSRSGRAFLRRSFEDVVFS